MSRVAFIHALPESLAPLDAELARTWPGCETMHLMDDSLSADLARSPHGLDERFDARFLALGAYAVSTGASGILFTCSAFGRCIDGVRRQYPSLPVLKPNEAMIDEATAAASGAPVGLVATFAPTLASMVSEFPAAVDVRTSLAVGALVALRAGDLQRHDALVAESAQRLVTAGCAIIALAQFSMARAASEVHAQTGVPVLTTVESAVRRLRARVEGAARA
ncbi:MAG: hypothetical protein IT359_13360 [Gemmatimonadaceae bacterium]|nr:hypothetical protein [Gemmatimonadaceae bacterium]